MIVGRGPNAIMRSEIIGRDKISAMAIVAMFFVLCQRLNASGSNMSGVGSFGDPNGDSREFQMS
jgi:hypothetical protein